MHWFWLLTVWKHGMPERQQNAVPAHSPSPVQLPTQAVIIVLHTAGEHETMVCAGQPPAPSQKAACVSVEPMHFWSAHWIVGMVQAVGDAPSQEPLHVPVPTHAVRVPCGCPLVKV